MTKIVLSTITVYKKISLALRASRVPIFVYTDCKFYPSCSDYAIKAVSKHGVIKGLAKSVARILRCSPFSRGGVDLP